MSRLSMVKKLLLTVSTGIALACSLAGCPGTETKKRPNVMLISIDTLRADHLSIYGYHRPTSPNIDRIARAGTLFTNAYSASSWTVPSHMTMLTSLPSIIHGVDDVGKSLDPARVTLAERFLDSGYRTAAFVSGPTLHSAFGFDQGFETYENLSGIAEEDYTDNPLRPSPAWKKSHHTITGPAVSKAAGEWLAGAVDSPFFLFVHLWDPHYDYIPPPPYDTRFDPGYSGDFDFSGLPFKRPKIAAMSEADKKHLVALYDGEIAATDAVVGEIVGALEKLGLIDRTLIVLTSDHGEGFFEHGLTGHGFTLHEEALRVPLIFRLPDRVEAGREVDCIFDPIHLMPTILRLAGLEPGPEARGRNLMELLQGGPPPTDLRAFMRLALSGRGPIYALRDGALKYHARPSSQAPLGLWVYYYSLDVDPHEKNALNLDKKEGVRVSQMLLEMIEEQETFARSLPRDGTEPKPLDDQTKEQLRALGYLE